MFCNRGMEKINVNRILKFKSSIARLPGKIKMQENIHVATSRLIPTIENKILNYKETTGNHCR